MKKDNLQLPAMTRTCLTLAKKQRERKRWHAGMLTVVRTKVSQKQWLARLYTGQFGEFWGVQLVEDRCNNFIPHYPKDSCSKKMTHMFPSLRRGDAHASYLYMWWENKIERPWQRTGIHLVSLVWICLDLAYQLECLVYDIRRCTMCIGFLFIWFVLNFHAESNFGQIIGLTKI
jgi:hypothetical protein